MQKILLIFSVSTFLIMVSHASELSCVSNNGIQYISKGRMSGVAPRPGDILGLDEVRDSDKIVYRKVTRLECNMPDNCDQQYPELEDINADYLPLSFIEKTKKVLTKEGSIMGPIYKETYVIQAEMDGIFWMICEYQKILYP